MLSAGSTELNDLHLRNLLRNELVGVGSLAEILGGTTEDIPDVPGDASSLDEGAAGDELPADPAPSRTSGGKRRARTRGARAAARKTTRQEQDQVRDALTMLLTVPMWAGQMKDPVCGGSVMENRDAIINSLVPIACRHPAALAFLTGSDAPWMEYLALMTALKPVIQTVWGHHVSHSIGSDAPDAEQGGGLVDLSRYTA